MIKSLASDRVTAPPQQSSRTLSREDSRAAKSGQVLDAAALQDRLMRCLKLPFGGRQPRAVVLVGGVTRSGSGGGCSSGGRGSNGLQHKRCSDNNGQAGGGSGCTGWSKQQHGQYQEHQRDQQPQRRVAITLGQMRGLVEPPEPTLTAGEWSVIEAAALARGDEDSPCPICREAFEGKSQVILSCSHVFHKACLRSFERLLRVGERSCPLCRKVDYQKRATTHGAVAWRQRCARRIQTAFRGHRTRNIYRAMLKRHFNAGLGDPRRRRHFLSGQAAETAGRLAAALDIRENTIDSLFEECDKGLAFSRQVFGPSAMSATRTDVEFSARENISKTSCAGVGTSTNQNGGEASASSEATEEERMWEQAWHQAAQRAEDECPICMCAMQPMNETRNPHAQYSEHKNDVQGRGPQSWPVTSGSKNARGVIGKNAAKFIPLRELESDAFGTSTASRNTPRQHRRGRGGFEGGQRARLLLSCSHTFHKTCLEAFENFNIYEVHLCPVCRQGYGSVDPSDCPRLLHRRR